MLRLSIVEEKTVDNNFRKTTFSLLFAFILGGMSLAGIPDVIFADEEESKVTTWIEASYIVKHKQMLYPVVRITSGNTGGSGTVVWSGKEDPKCQTGCTWYTYVLTNHHVIASAIEIKPEWNPELSKTVRREYRQTVNVEVFSYNNYSHSVGSSGIQADIITYDERQDIALLRLRDNENKAKWVANIFPIDKVDQVHIYDKLYAVGAALGNPPLSTTGMLNYMDKEIDNYNYWLSSAQTIYGNSGGAVFRYSAERTRYEYVGMPARIAVTGGGFFSSMDAITHMGYFVPITRLTGFLEDHYYRFIYDSSFTYIGEKQVREDVKKKRDKLRDLYDAKEEFSQGHENSDT